MRQFTPHTFKEYFHVMKIGIILGSTRPGRNGKAVANWVYELASQRDDAEYELVDLIDYPLPHLDEAAPAIMGQYQGEHTKRWAEKIGSFDGFIMVTPEYNHSTSGVLKNAIDYLYNEWNNKAVGFVVVWRSRRRPRRRAPAPRRRGASARGCSQPGNALAPDRIRELHRLQAGGLPNSGTADDARPGGGLVYRPGTASRAQRAGTGAGILKLDGKVALVTGASQGIGRTIAEQLAADGASVVVNYYPPERDHAEAVVAGIREHGGTAVAAPADIADAAQLRGLFDTAEENFGQLDIVVLNAANVTHGSIVDTTDEAFDSVFATNARAGFVALREAAIRLRDGGRIVAISAGLTVMPRAGTGVYAASKAATDHLVRVLAREIGHRRITVNSVLPGAVMTPALIHAGQELIDAEIAQTPLGRVGETTDISNIVGFLVSDEGGWVTGQTIGAGGGMF